MGCTLPLKELGLTLRLLVLYPGGIPTLFFTYLYSLHKCRHTLRSRDFPNISSKMWNNIRPPNRNRRLQPRKTQVPGNVGTEKKPCLNGRANGRSEMSGSNVEAIDKLGARFAACLKESVSSYFWVQLRKKIQVSIIKADDAWTHKSIPKKRARNVQILTFLCRGVNRGNYWQ